MGDNETARPPTEAAAGSFSNEELAAGMAELLLANMDDDALFCPGIVPDEQTEAWAQRRLRRKLQ